MTVNTTAWRSHTYRLQTRTAVQHALQLWMNATSYDTVKPVWTRFWNASDAYSSASAALAEADSALLTAVFTLGEVEEQFGSGKALQADLTVARSRHLTAVAEQGSAREVYDETAATFDEVCADAAAQAAAFFVKLSQDAAAGVASSVAAVSACAKL